MKVEDFKEGMIVIYTELPFSDYANSLNEIVDIDGVLYPKPICIEWKGEYISYSSIENAIPVKDFFDPMCWFIVDDYDNYFNSDPIEYMNKKMPLGELRCEKCSTYENFKDIKV